MGVCDCGGASASGRTTIKWVSVIEEGGGGARASGFPSGRTTIKWVSVIATIKWVSVIEEGERGAGEWVSVGGGLYSFGMISVSWGGSC